MKITGLGEALLIMLRVIPDGVVVFFPSYSLVDQYIDRWKSTPASMNDRKDTIWTAMNNLKPVLLEQRSGTRSNEKGIQGLKGRTQGIEHIFADYAASISTGSGAVMFAVIGGSLSEGINFSDALGRAVIVVGLPFPDPHNVEWKARLDYISSSSVADQRFKHPDEAAFEFSENACMRAVNQCIGRAIRHKDDFAAILLLDHRYNRASIKNKLPGWIRSSLTDAQSSVSVVPVLKGFFDAKSSA